MLENFHLEAYQMGTLHERVQLDRDLASYDVKTILMEHAFEAAFRTGLGNPTIARKTNSAVSSEMIASFLQEAWGRSGHIVSASGLENLELSEIVKARFTTSAGPESPPADPVPYFGGERRVEFCHPQNHVLFAFGTGGLASGMEDLCARILVALIGGNVPVKYGKAYSALAGVMDLLSKESSATLSATLSQSSDGGLLGVHISAPRHECIKTILECFCRELKAFSLATASPKEIAAAKHRAGFEVLAEVEGRIGQASFLADKAR